MKKRALQKAAPILYIKLRICMKEIRETRSWLRLIIRAGLLPDKRMAKMLDESTQLCNILGQSIVTATQNKRPKRAMPIVEE
jgi:hypothetical protein